MGHSCLSRHNGTEWGLGGGVGWPQFGPHYVERRDPIRLTTTKNVPIGLQQKPPMLSEQMKYSDYLPWIFVRLHFSKFISWKLQYYNE